MKPLSRIFTLSFGLLILSGCGITKSDDLPFPPEKIEENTRASTPEREAKKVAERTKVLVCDEFIRYIPGFTADSKNFIYPNTTNKEWSHGSKGFQSKVKVLFDGADVDFHVSVTHEERGLLFEEITDEQWRLDFIDRDSDYTYSLECMEETEESDD